VTQSLNGVAVAVAREILDESPSSTYVQVSLAMGAQYVSHCEGIGLMDGTEPGASELRGGVSG